MPEISAFEMAQRQLDECVDVFKTGCRSTFHFAHAHAGDSCFVADTDG